MKLKEYLFNTKLNTNHYIAFPIILVALFGLGFIGSNMPDLIIGTLMVSYLLVTLSFVFTRNILVPTALFVIYNSIVTGLSGNIPGLGMAIFYALLQSLFIGLVFYLVNHFDKKPKTKISFLDGISILITVIILTLGSVILAI